MTGQSERDAPREVNPEDRFDWLIRLASEQLREQPAPYQYVLVDEYQDVNPAQYELITRLAAFDRTPSKPTPGADEDDREQPGYLVAVGDDDQNLYSFQGADIEFIRRFQQDYDIPGDGVVPLLSNYRSLPRLVEAANAFIEAALPAQARLKGDSDRVVSVRTAETTEGGEVQIGRYRHRYHAALGVACRAATLIHGGAPAHQLAVLAREWTHLHEVQHALREQGVPYQLLNVREQLRPAASLIGSALREALTAQPDMPAADAHATLNSLREGLGLSERDRAWAAILHATQDLHNTTWGALALRIDAARPLAQDGVVLSTYHSAKGSEFDHVFVLNEGMCRHGLLSRPYQTALQAIGIQAFALPTDEPLPPRIRYRIDGDPADLYISAPELLGEQGRAAVNRYAHHWPDLTRNHLRLSTSQGVSRLGSKGTLAARLGRVQAQGTVRAQGATILRCERDDEWYDRAGYVGTATHHHHVLPTFDIEEPLRE
nr:ATP-dependent helicase [Deinococcus sp. AJ005]